MEDRVKLYHEALQEFKESHVESAAAKLSQIIERNPTFEDAYEALSVILYNQKRYDEAIDLIKKWLSLNPNTVMAHTNLSRCYVAKGMILEAEHAQAEARRLTWKAELHGKKQTLPKIDYAEQIARFKEVIELDSNDILGYYSLASTYLEAGQKRDAVDAFEKGLSIDPNHSSSYLGLGMALEGLGDQEKAKKIYRQGIQVADKKGDIMPLRKMEALLRALENKGKE